MESPEPDILDEEFQGATLLTKSLPNERTKRRALLIVRAGDRSLHPHWLRAARVRNFDLHISYFGRKDLSEIPLGNGVTATAEIGPKFRGLLTCLQKLGERVDEYDYVGFPDDDLYANGATWNWFFEVVFELQPSIAQPALHRASFYTFPWLLQVPGLKARWTNFVEVMMPVFSLKALRKVLPYFGENEFGWGMDYLWPHLFEAKKRTLCIVDLAPVLHTRAVRSGPLYSVLNDNGANPTSELEAFLARHRVSLEPFRVFGAVDKGDRLVEEVQGCSEPWIGWFRTVVRQRLSITEIRASRFHII